MNENMLLRTVVEEELNIYEARFGRAVCPEAKETCNREKKKAVITILIVMIILVTLIRMYVAASGISCVFFFGLFLLLWKLDSVNKMFQICKNPLIFYVSELAKENPDTKIKDINNNNNNS